RPAAIQQLNVVAQKAGVRVHDPAGQMDPVGRAKGAVAEAGNLGFDTVIVDSAGRLHIDDELMMELESIRTATEASDLLYVADAMTGQDAIKSAGEFNRRLGVTGVVLSKLDGDARGSTHIINGSRRKRIARGSGTSVEEVNRLLKQFAQMRKMLKAMGGMVGGKPDRKARERLGSLMRHGR